MNTPFPPFRFVTRRNLFASALLTGCMISGCQTPGGSSSALLGGKQASTQPVSETSEAGLPEPTNTATPNGPQSLSSVDENLRLGEEELGRGNYQQAQMHFDHVLKSNPDHVKAHHRLGVLADKMGQFPQAEEHYLTALNGDPKNAALLSDLGYSYYMQGRYADCERYLLEARKVDPKYSTALANLGLLYGSTGRQQEALAMFRQIGDDAQVEKIMQQIAAGELKPGGQVPANRTTSSDAVVTTQTSVQTAAPAPAGQQNDASRDFVENLRQAREELKHAEQQYASHQQAQNSQSLAQNSPSAESQRLAAAWSRQGTTPSGPSSPGYNTGAPTPRQMTQQGGRLPDGALPDAMANFDQQNRPNNASNPIMIGHPETAESLPQGAVNPQSWMQQPNRTAQASTPAPFNAGSPQPSHDMGMQIVSQPRQTPATAMQITPNGNESQQLSADFVVSAGDDQTANPPSAWAQQFASTLNQTNAPNGTRSASPVQQMNGTAPPSNLNPVEHAYHTQQHNSSNDIALTGQNRAANPALGQPPQQDAWGTPPPVTLSQGQTAGTPAATSSPNSFDEARREAAMLGLSAGPGQVFPYIQKSQRVVPGSDSGIKPAQAAAPTRQLPSGLTPPAGYTTTNQPSAQNNNGQPTIAPSQYATGQPGSQNGSFTSQQPSIHPQSTPAPYQSAQQSAEPNRLTNQTWGQSPQNSHYGTTPPATAQPTGTATGFTPSQSYGAPAHYSQEGSAALNRQVAPVGYEARTTELNQATPANSDQTGQLPVIQGQRNTAPAAETPSYPTIIPGERR